MLHKFLSRMRDYQGAQKNPLMRTSHTNVFVFQFFSLISFIYLWRFCAKPHISDLCSRATIMPGNKQQQKSFLIFARVLSKKSNTRQSEAHKKSLHPWLIAALWKILSIVPARSARGFWFNKRWCKFKILTAMLHAYGFYPVM